jgi:hypothetical protein
VGGIGLAIGESANTAGDGKRCEFWYGENEGGAIIEADDESDLTAWNREAIRDGG